MATARSPADPRGGQAALEALGPGRFRLSGDLVFENAARLLADGQAAFGAESPVEVDLSQVGRVDSAGLALLVEWSVAARGDGRAIRFRNAPPMLGALAGISDLSNFLDDA